MVLDTEATSHEGTRGASTMASTTESEGKYL